MRRTRWLAAVTLVAAMTAPLEAQVIRAYWVSSPTDIWVVGSWIGPNAVHYDGTRWTAVPFDGTGNFYIFGMWGSGPSDVWAVGSTFANTPCVFRWDGTRWSPVSLPATATGRLTGITGRGPREVYAVTATESESDTGKVLAWNGTAWSVIREPFPFLTNSIAMVGAELWLAGGVTRDPTPDQRRDYGLVARYAAGRWTVDGFNGTRATNPLVARNAWGGLQSGGVRNLMYGRDTSGSIVLALNEGGAWRTVAAPENATSAFLLGNGRLIAYAPATEFSRYTASGWVPFAAQRAVGGQAVQPLGSVSGAWSAAGSEIAYMSSGPLLLRVQSDTVTVLFNYGCFVDARRANQPACAGLGAGSNAAVAAPAPGPVAPQAAPGAASGKYGRQPPTGLPRPARP